MALFRKRGTDTSLPKGDRGAGSFDDYAFDLIPRNPRVTITLANSDPFQDELRAILESGEPTVETAISPRSAEQDRVDAPIEVRLFTGRRVTGVVGSVPRGLESVIDETLRRLEDRGDKPRIPAKIVGKPGALRVQLKMGATR
ncbi:MAG TPA: hypothetical protein VGO65_00630 [Pseudolysinimonas sp.]|jgi:hypothetical protein|nr:hypothetical protein [Schumannella sp.]HEV7740899.1 hypothetical protein [Pseudolysinimonas sp.]